MTTFLCSLLAAQLLRGVIPFEDEDGNVQDVSFYDLANAFIGMYVISSTENWTTMLYAATESAGSVVAAACYAAFIIIWFIFSNFIVLNMFVAVITENLEVGPDVKRRGQIKEFVEQYAKQMNELGSANTNGIKVIRGFINKGKRVLSHKKVTKSESIESGDAVFNMLLDGKVVEGFLDEKEESYFDQDVNDIDFRGIFHFFKKVFGRSSKKDNGKIKEVNPFKDPSIAIPESKNAADFAHEYIRSKSTRDELFKTYLEKNPKYDKALYLFSQESKIRRFCQRIVNPSLGVRSNGVYPKPIVGVTFWTLMLLATIGMVVLSCVNTPLYFKDYTDQHGLSARNWVTYTDATFVAVFTVEAIVKVIADGFHFTPNAYTKSSWNNIDMIVLITMWITLISESFFQGYVSRYVRSFEAFRALRLMTVSVTAQNTFHSVIIVGFGKIFGAALISLSLLIPFSIWGLNIFHGKLSYCTDGSVNEFSECVDEYLSTPFNWEIYTPRAITKTYYDYDNFGHAFLVQFEVISLEGWVDVLNSVMSITGSSTNPVSFASRYNGIFPMLYNILGTIFILTLFISVIIKNYSQNRGTAYLKDEQLTWYEIKKLLSVVQPSFRAVRTVPGSFRHKLQKAVQTKGSWYHKTETGLLFILVVALVVEYYPTDEGQTLATKILLLITTVAYILHFIAKFYAVGWRKFGRRRWNIFGFIVSVFAFVFTIIGSTENASSTFFNFQKLGVTGMILLWIPKSSRLDQLFKTASASFREIFNLLITWLILFLAYAIAFNQVFGLTRIGPNGSGNINFRTVPKALILLFRMSCGEGWNQILSDYLVSPPYCVDGPMFSKSDCGSHPFAYFLFITWNILSMYIFVNMFISLIFENFSYVFHHGSSHISKKDIKKFKDTWEKYDPEGTGYISIKQLHSFLRQCDGYFSMKIYDGKFTVPNILASSRARNPEDPYDVDVVALNSVLRTIPFGEYAKKQAIYELFCAEAFEKADPELGISFNSLLLQFPLYKTMDYGRCLK
ncbi:Cch1p [Sugiyamaella lignohabitans]|uniref:Calcium-channel protein CCH1 n=1 Tax=Sugiyamaella lignohabitans TaxID=796027 RepID=A0A161HN15_9ASCO|nr:Cch1p [Sugiyamaella lignohabitans]ANB15427.1 Cch1p [Sugiyamaella lignohabitans]